MKQSSRFDAFFDRVSSAAGITTQLELADLLNVNRSAVTQAKQRDAIPEKWLYILARDHDFSPAWLERGEGPMKTRDDDATRPDAVLVPKVRATLCAGGGSFDVSATTVDHTPFASPWINRKGVPNAMVLMDIIGNSMEPALLDGDTVLIDQSQNTIFAGGIYAVGVEDTVLVKRLEKRPGALVLLSDNPDYQPIMLRGEELDTVRVVGKIIWSCREYR